MEPDDPEKHIADLERQIAEQKRIADLERQLAEAKAAAGQYGGVEQRAQSLGASGLDAAQLREALSGVAAAAGVSRAQLDDALHRAKVTVKTSHSTFYPWQNGAPQPFNQMSFSQPAFGQPPPFQRRRSMNVAGVFGGIVGLLGGCIGAAAALTAVFPSTALWTSAIVCGAPNQLMINTSHYSYKPGQSGTNIDFQCLRPDGAQSAGFFAIAAMQLLVVLLMAAGVIAVGYLVKRLRRNQPLTPARLALAGGVAIVSIVVVVAFVWQAIAGSSAPVQIPPGGSLTVNGNGETKTIACNDGHLTVNGRDETITVTGHCGSVSVDGVIHHVTIDSADAIDVDGVHNVVTYHSGSPKVTNSGVNSVKQG